MKVQDAIAHADALRPNVLPEERKYAWLTTLDGKLAAETLLTDPPVYKAPANAETEMLMQPPYDDIYELYLCAQIDLANQESTLYANDYAIFNNAITSACAHYRRTHEPPSSGHFRVM